MQEIACKNRQTFYTTHPTPSNFKKVSVIGFSTAFSVIVFQFVIVCLKSDTVYQLNFMKSMHNLFSFLKKDLLNE